MKLLSASSVLLLVGAISPSISFVVQPPMITSTTSSTASANALSMGLFDFFSEDAKNERAETKRLEVEEQERLQAEIRERRTNPEKMEEYEAKIRIRRQLRMEGLDEAADTISAYDSEAE